MTSRRFLRFATVLLILLTLPGMVTLTAADDPPTEVGRQAQAMKDQGWVYVMPRPKSPQAAWGNTDGRTTWWLGYWRNSETRKYSRTPPTLNAERKYVGDDVSDSGKWRRGGSPDPNSFSELQLLMSNPATHPPSRRRRE